MAFLSDLCCEGDNVKVSKKFDSSFVGKMLYDLTKGQRQNSTIEVDFTEITNKEYIIHIHKQSGRHSIQTKTYTILTDPKIDVLIPYVTVSKRNGE
jgi:FlaG/FlaF family flagellin (archaellin)